MNIADIFFGILNGRCAECGKAIIYYKQEISFLGPTSISGGFIMVHSDCSNAFYANKHSANRGG